MSSTHRRPHGPARPGPPGRPVRAARALILALGWLLMAAAAQADIYGWVDARGVQHYSDRIEDVPPEFRNGLEPVIEQTEEAEPRSGGFAGMGRFFGGDGEDADAPGADRGDAGEAVFEPNVDAFAARRLAERFEGPMMLVGGFVGLVMMGLVFAVGTWVLLIACRLVGQESPGFRKGYGIVVVQFVAGAALAPGVVVVMGPPAGSSIGELLGFQLAQGLLSLSVSAMVLRAMLCETLGRAVGLAIAVVVVTFAMGAVLGLGVVMCAGGAAIVGAG